MIQDVNRPTPAGTKRALERAIEYRMFQESPRNGYPERTWYLIGETKPTAELGEQIIWHYDPQTRRPKHIVAATPSHGKEIASINLNYLPSLRCSTTHKTAGLARALENTFIQDVLQPILMEVSRRRNPEDPLGRRLSRKLETAELLHA